MAAKWIRRSNYNFQEEHGAGNILYICKTTIKLAIEDKGKLNDFPAAD